MTVPSVHCEAKKIAYRQTKDGLVVAFVIHPNDMPDDLAIAPLGQRYMLAMTAIGDDEQPIEPASRHSPAAAERPGSEATPPPSAGANPSAASQRGKERYANATAREQALIRAGRLPKDLRYQQWAAQQTLAPASEESALFFLRAAVGIESRREIADDPQAYMAFVAHESEYLIDTQQLAEPR